MTRKKYPTSQCPPPILLATSDEDLKERLTVSQRPRGQSYSLPPWLGDVDDVLGDPRLVSEARAQALCRASNPVNNSERRYIRNRAATEYIAAELVREIGPLQRFPHPEPTMQAPTTTTTPRTTTRPRFAKLVTQSKRDLERATSDQQLKDTLSTCDWLRDRDYELPGWLNGSNDIKGVPANIQPNRLQNLLHDGATRNNNERRFLRNRFVIDDISEQLELERPQVPDGAIPVTPRSPELSVQSHAQAPTHGSQYNMPDLLAEPSYDPRIKDVTTRTTNTSNLDPRTAESDYDKADRLRKTVLAPFFDRIERDTQEILRLRQEKEGMTAEIEQHKLEVAQLQQNSVNEDAELDDSGKGYRGAKRKVAATSPMRVGDDVNGNNEYTLEGHLAHLANKICNDLSEAVQNETIQLCGLAPLRIMEHRPNDVLELASQKLHAWPFRNVPVCWRRLYEDASLYQAVELLRERAGISDCSANKRRKIASSPQASVFAEDDWLSRIVRTLDTGVMLSGAPGRASTYEAVFQQLENYTGGDGDFVIPSRFGITFPAGLETQHPIARAANTLSFEDFQHHLNISSSPLIITGTMTHWPASTHWASPAYFLRQTLGGRRLVPVEIGKMYTDDEWSQTIVTFWEFMKKYLLPNRPSDMGYLAQHDLFAQIPALKEDVLIPDYCYTTPPEPDEAASRTAGLASAPHLNEPQLNAWVGPKGTITPLHTDPYHNILCQVVGYKYVRLYSPSETPNLYPHGVDEKGISLENTSQVDISHFRSRSLGGKTDLDALREIRRVYPRVDDAKFVEGILAPGECLYIPLGWWHYVESLSTSFSVSFWWN